MDDSTQPSAGSDGNASPSGDGTATATPALAPDASQAVAPAPALAVVATTDKPNAWTKLLLRASKTGPPKKILANALIALRFAPDFKAIFRYNGFSAVILVDKPTPWDPQTDWKPRQWEDFDNLKLTEWLQRRGIEINKNIAGDAAFVVAKEREFHPVRDYLASLSWDGKPRLDDWLITYLGAKSEPYERTVGPKYLISAVARIMDPGCQADCVLILMGSQGQGKSTLMKALVGPEWYTDQIGGLTGGKDTSIAMAGKLMIEFADLEGFHGRSADELKAFISRTTDRYRSPYGRYAEDHQRQCVFIGTTNQVTPLKDFTGNRRFWPVPVLRADIAGIRQDRDQLWAEAFARYKAKEPHFLEKQEERDLADSKAEESREIDVWQDVIEQELVNKDEIRINEVMTMILEIPTAKITRSDQMRAANAMTALGWVRVRKRVGIQRSWVYRRKEKSEVVLAAKSDQA